MKKLDIAALQRVYETKVHRSSLLLVGAVVVSLATLGVGGYVGFRQAGLLTESPESAIRGRQAAGGPMTFEVTVPRSTPSDDVIYIYTNEQKGKRMGPVGPFTHRVTLTREQAGAGVGEEVAYRYSRNRADFLTAEYLEPDTNDYFWTRLGRTTRFVPGGVQRDTVQRWRWFPPAEIPIIRTTNLSPQGSFLPRIDGRAFRSGQILEDLYVEGFRDHFTSTAQHLNALGYTWVEIDPPWQWTEQNGLPRVANLIDENPNYPDDQTLVDEIRALKAEGLHVMLGPQLCCTELSTQGRSKAWWDAYFAETTKFLVHFAQLAERADADAIHYAIGHDYWEPDYAERWRAVFREVRKHFSGEVGEMLWNFGSQPGAIIPDADFITWGSELDYFYVAIDTPISRSDNPTDTQLLQGAATMLDGVKQLYDRYRKPVFVRTTYFSVQKTWKGNEFYSISAIPWVSDPEARLAESTYRYGPEDQVRVIQAYFRAIAERPWIIGYAQFGYTRWEYPLAPVLSVRGKPSEDLWRKWNERIYQR